MSQPVFPPPSPAAAPWRTTTPRIGRQHPSLVSEDVILEDWAPDPGQTDPAAAVSGALPSDGAAIGMREAAALPEMLSIAEVARIFGRSGRSISRWCAAGHLVPVRIRRAVFFRSDDLRQLLAAGITKAVVPRAAPARHSDS